MIDFRTYTLFAVAALAVIAAPGPDILYVLSRAISGGKRIGSISAFGIAAGEVLHTLLAVLGLAALIQASTPAFLMVKYIGAVYLVYLGIRVVRERNDVALESIGPASDWKVFRQGVLTNLFNPKAILFFVTFLPQFVIPVRGHAQLQLVSLGFTFAVLDVIFLKALACSAGHVNAWLTRKPENARRSGWLRARCWWAWACALLSRRKTSSSLRTRPPEEPLSARSPSFAFLASAIASERRATLP